MSIYSDYECGALTDAEFRRARVDVGDEENVFYGYLSKCPYRDKHCEGKDCKKCLIYLENHEET